MYCPKCFEFNIPDSANFCPNCGRQLRPGKFVVMDITELPAKEEKTKIPKVPRMSITKCEFFPSSIKQGEQSILRWEGQNVKNIEIDGFMQPSKQNIVFAPKKSKMYAVIFIGEDGTRVRKELVITVHSPYLFDGKGYPSTNSGLYVVDIRQCKRTQGIGWNGRYEFTPGLPVGFKGFYAMFDSNMNIQILVENGKLSTIFFTLGKATIKYWIGTKRESYDVVEEGSVSFKTVTKYRDKTVIYMDGYRENKSISSAEAQKHATEFEPIINIMEQFDSKYAKDFFDFFGEKSFDSLCKGYDLEELNP